MSRGFVSQANKARAARLEELRRGYLRAIAWRRAEWLAHTYAERARARDIVRHLMPANREQARADDAAALERAERAAWVALLAWPGAISSTGPRPWERSKQSRSEWEAARQAKNAAI